MLFSYSRYINAQKIRIEVLERERLERGRTKEKGKESLRGRKLGWVASWERGCRKNRLVFHEASAFGDVTSSSSEFVGELAILSGKLFFDLHGLLCAQ